MTARIGNVPLGVDIAIAQSELRNDRREIRQARASLDVQRIRLGQDRNETAYIVKTVGAALEATATQATREIEDTQLKASVDGLGQALGRTLQDGFEQLRQDGARIRSLASGEDLAGKSLTKTSTQLAKLRRSQGST